MEVSPIADGLERLGDDRRMFHQTIVADGREAKAGEEAHMGGSLREGNLFGGQ